MQPDGSTLIQPISIGLVAENGREYYAEWPNAREVAASQPWLAANVLPHLRHGRSTRPDLPIYVPEDVAAECQAGYSQVDCARAADQIRADIEAFCSGSSPEWVINYGGFDWVILSALWGGMLKMPKGWPYAFHEAQDMNLPRVEQDGAEHNALSDARTIRRAWLKRYSCI